MIAVRSGVPQSSILSPTVFVISVHDFPSREVFKLGKYADDTIFGTSLKNYKEYYNLFTFGQSVVT